MRTHADIVKAAKAEALAAKLALSIHTVRSWVVRDKIPDEHWIGLANEGHATLEELAAYAAQKKAA